MQRIVQQNVQQASRCTACSSWRPRLLPIALHVGGDVCELLPLWFSQELAGEDGDRLYQASKRMLSALEFGLIAVARDIYLGDDGP